MKGTRPNGPSQDEAWLPRRALVVGLARSGRAAAGALAAFAIMMKVEVLLLFIGGVFVIEALSVMIQVFSFKRFGRRVFLMAPIHYHFEMKAWTETKIMIRFWIIAGILCAVGFAVWYRYYLKFKV